MKALRAQRRGRTRRRAARRAARRRRAGPGSLRCRLIDFEFAPWFEIATAADSHFRAHSYHPPLSFFARLCADLSDVHDLLAHELAGGSWMGARCSPAARSRPWPPAGPRRLRGPPGPPHPEACAGMWSPQVLQGVLRAVAQKVDSSHTEIRICRNSHSRRAGAVI